MTAADPSAFARLYQAQYAQYQDDLPYWSDLADRFGDPILELGCGPGRVLFHLAAEGHQIAGLDNDRHMLARARQALRPPESMRISLHLADMTNFEFGHGFGLIIVPCNTFAYLDETQASGCLQSCRQHLPDGQALALDLPNPHILVEGAPEPDEPLTDYLEPDSGNPVQVYAQQVRAESDQLHVTWHYDELLPDGQTQRHTYQQCYHLRSAQAVVELMGRHGFDRVDVFGDYDQSPLADSSNRMLVLAQVG